MFTNGTAHSQLKALSVKSPDNSTTLRYPALGKTGTTNDYRNVAFMGALPTYVDAKNGVALDSVVAIGSYVGFDDNKPLKSGRTRIAGASGGLPQWAAFAKEEINILGIPEKIDFLDISILATGEVPLILTNERGELTVDPMTGIAMAGASISEGRPLPWLDVPGFTPPQVQERAAEASAEMGIITSLPTPGTAEEPAAARRNYRTRRYCRARADAGHRTGHAAQGCRNAQGRRLGFARRPGRKRVCAYRSGVKNAHEILDKIYPDGDSIIRACRLCG